MADAHAQEVGQRHSSVFAFAAVACQRMNPGAESHQTFAPPGAEANRSRRQPGAQIVMLLEKPPRLTAHATDLQADGWPSLKQPPGKRARVRPIDPIRVEP